MRICLFTDTLGDVNGVSRFIRAMCEQAERGGCELTAACSTRFEVPEPGNLVNFLPRLAARMPRYENLEIVWPPARRMLGWARRMRPDAIHVSTPGPVGLVGRRAARLMNVPLVGVYHTDFPAYIGHLFDDAACTWMAAAYMRWFYRPFARVLTRSRGYGGAVEALGIARGRIEALRPGIDVGAFHARHRDEGVWARLGVPAGVKVLYVGRVSVEKGLPLLARAWRMVRGEHGPAEEPPTRGTRPRLVIVGDGPYRQQMEHELAGCSAVFLGFRHGPELSAIYASADLFAFPSATDTLGQVVMEAQASGLPVLVTDEGGPREVVSGGEEGGTGFVLPAHDAGAWARAIARLIDDAPLRTRMGAAAHESMQSMTMAACFEQFRREHEHALHA